MSRKSAFYLTQSSGFNFDDLTKQTQLKVLEIAGRAEDEIIKVLMKQPKKSLPDNQ